MAFEDAVVLGAELRAHADDLRIALRAYEQRRRPRCGTVRDRTRERDRTRDVPPALRDPMLRRRGLRIFREQYRGLLPPL
jgi:FAD-dependent urate hydroxylase